MRRKIISALHLNRWFNTATTMKNTCLWQLQVIPIIIKIIIIFFRDKSKIDLFFTARTQPKYCRSIELARSLMSSSILPSTYLYICTHSAIELDFFLLILSLFFPFFSILLFFLFYVVCQTKVKWSAFSRTLSLQPDNNESHNSYKEKKKISK